MLNCIGKKGEVGPVGTSLLGTISGYVELYKTPYTKERSFAGATITAFNATTTAIGISDSIGRYHINNLKTGTYNIMATKDTFGIYKQYGFQLIGGDLPAFTEKMKLSKLILGKSKLFDLTIITISGNKLSVGISSYDTIKYTPLNQMSRMFFINYTPDVSYNNYLYKSRGGRRIFNSSVYNTFTRDRVDFLINILTKDSLYMACYSYNDFENQYMDFEKNLYINEGIDISNRSNVVKIKIP